MTREIVLDIETTGLDPKDGHRIIEVACVELLNQFPTGSHFHRFVNPERDVPEEARRIHGIATEFLLDKPLFAEVAPELLAYVADSPLVIHNAGFDVGFLNHELQALALPALSMARVQDTLMLARRKHPGAPASLDALCKRYGIDLSGRTKHGALVDCELLAAVYLALNGGQQARLDLATAREERQRDTRRRSRPLPARPRPLAPRLSEAERQAHEAFLETLKDALWLKAEPPPT